MKAVTWALVAALAAGLLVAEIAMGLTNSERLKLYQVFGATALGTLLVALAVLNVVPRVKSLRTSLQVVALSAVVVTGGSVAIAATTMFIEPHDLQIVLVALVLAVGLGGVVAASVARPLTTDLSALSDTARGVAAGDLSVRSGVERTDELGKAAAAFDEMVERLEMSERERSYLLAAISHDLRTPLASMQAALEALQDGLAPDPPAYLRGLSIDLAHLRTLVDDLFVMSRLEAGSYELTRTDVDLAELADEAVEAVAPTAAQRRVKILVDAPARTWISADPVAIGRVLRNLLVNAIRYSPDGSEVRVSLMPGDSQVEVMVIDQGQGFAAEVRGTAFDPFVRAEESRNRDAGGSGLGLTIAKGIIEAHGGDIEILGGPGGRVRFALPVEPTLSN